MPRWSLYASWAWSELCLVPTPLNFVIRTPPPACLDRGAGELSVAYLTDTFERDRALGHGLLYDESTAPSKLQRITLTIVRDAGYRKPKNRFPFNLLRNRAVHGCAAPLVLVTDVDFVLYSSAGGGRTATMQAMRRLAAQVTGCRARLLVNWFDIAHCHILSRSLNTRSHALTLAHSFSHSLTLCLSLDLDFRRFFASLRSLDLPRSRSPSLRTLARTPLVCSALSPAASARNRLLKHVQLEEGHVQDVSPSSSTQG
eukprot:4623709-Pleurochrysis_carterae.AAC.2